MARILTLARFFWILVCSGAMATGPSKHTVSNKLPSGFLHGGRSSSKGTCRLGFRHQEPLRAILVSRFASTLISKPVYTAVNTKIAVYGFIFIPCPIQNMPIPTCISFHKVIIRMVHFNYLWNHQEHQRSVENCHRDSRTGLSRSMRIPNVERVG